MTTTDHTTTAPTFERRVEPELPDSVPAMLIRASGTRLVMLTNPTVEQDVVEDCMAVLCAEMGRMLDGQGRSATAVVHHHDGMTLLEVPMQSQNELLGHVYSLGYAAGADDTHDAHAEDAGSH